MYVDNPACIRVKVGESEWFRIDSKVRQGMGRRGVRLLR